MFDHIASEEVTWWCATRMTEEDPSHCGLGLLRLLGSFPLKEMPELVCARQWELHSHSQNHGMVHIDRDLKDHPGPAPLPWSGTPCTWPGCLKPIQPGLADSSSCSPCPKHTSWKVKLPGQILAPGSNEVTSLSSAQRGKGFCQWREGGSGWNKPSYSLVSKTLKHN